MRVFIFYEELINIIVKSDSKDKFQVKYPGGN